MYRHTLLGTVTLVMTLMIMAGVGGVFSQADGAAGGTLAGDWHGTMNFFSSFEPDDPPLTWENTVEHTDFGERMTVGVSGYVPSARTPGSVTSKVVRVRASANNAPHESEQKLIDGDPNTKWLAFHSTGWVAMELTEPTTVVTYTFTSANDAPGRDPRNWRLEGSHDGETWVVLDERTDESFNRRFQTKTYDVAIPDRYTHYRWTFTRNAGDNIIQLADIELIGDEADAAVAVPPHMVTAVSPGPANPYAAKAHAGFSGLYTLQYAGRHTTSDRAYAYNKIYDVHIPVGPDTELSYLIFPEFAGHDHLNFSGTYVAVDLRFTDGTYLHELNAYDQHGVGLNARAQGDSKTLYVNQWNHKKSRIGDVAAGKTIDRILVAYDNPHGPTVFRGFIDDVRIEHAPAAPVVEHFTDYVDTRRGTHSNGVFSRGNTFPAVAVPHGFNFWTPVTNAGSDWLYQYHESNNDDNLPAMEAFALSHEPSPWMGDRQTFQVMPVLASGIPEVNRQRRALAFRHEMEVAKPHYYRVAFENGIVAEMTPTDHAAMMRFVFPDGGANIVFDNVSNNGGITLHSDERSISAYTDQKSGLSTGASRMFIYAEFDRPIVESGRLTGEGRDNVTAYFKFDTDEMGEGKASNGDTSHAEVGNLGANSTDRSVTVTMRIATSLISVEQAKRNLELEIASDDTFESVKARAHAAWEDKLSIIEVEGATDDQLVTLYSNMYRLFLYPNSAYENVGTKEKPEYVHAVQVEVNPCQTSTATETCAQVAPGQVYVNNGFWDTYRTAWPAYALFTPTKAGEMIDGFVQHYRDGGWIPRWSSPGYADLMVGTSANVAFADAYLKGVTNFDVRAFYESALKDATVVPPNNHVGRKGMVTSIFNGYTDTSTGEGLSWALDGYINDFGIANLARALAETESTRERSSTTSSDPYKPYYADDARYFTARAQQYVNVFNPEVGFFMGRQASGAWRASPAQFDPAAWWGDYTETNAWNMAFHAPHDGQGLANLYGGREGLARKLDAFFATPERTDGTIHEMREAKDIRMGMYAHSNQPSHHIIYMYNYAGEPWKTQHKVREVLERLYLGSEIGQGYPGDEDNGEMSAWYIFSALGFYPLRVGSPEYVIGAPLFQQATVQLENGRQIVVSAPGNSRENRYVQSVTLNGEPYNKTYITHDDLVAGAVLVFEMGPEPSEWGSDIDALPPSMTPVEADGKGAPQPLRDLTDGLLRSRNGIATDSDGGLTRALFDNTSNIRWTVNNPSPWVQFEFVGGPETVHMYTLTSGIPTPDRESPAADPKSWRLLGSQDGETWELLDERIEEVFQWRRQTRVFSVTHPGSYRFYRLDILENNGHDTTTLSEMELLG